MFYVVLKVVFKIALQVFFRKIEVRNRHLIPTEGPLLIAANHPNTFMDPVAIAAITGQEVYFIAKATFFNSGFTKWLLHKMNLIPVYRQVDGPVTGGSNTDTFRKCYDFLQAKGTLMIFPEGNSFNERRLRKLKTGAARIALGTEAQTGFTAQVKILPVGLNYSEPTQFRSKLFINIGEPIEVNQFAAKYAEDSFKAAQEITDILKVRLEELLVITETDEEDELIQQVETIYKEDLVSDLKLTKSTEESDFKLSRAIAESIRYFREKDPVRIAGLKKLILDYSLNLKKLGLKDQYLQLREKDSSLVSDLLSTVIFLLLGFPVYIWGVITNYLPYYIPAKVADKLTSEEEFRAPIMMTTGIFTFPVYYGLLIWGFYALEITWPYLLLIVIMLPVSGFFALYYWKRLALTRGYFKLFALFYKRGAIINNLQDQRTEIISQLVEAKNIYVQQFPEFKSKVQL